MSSRFLLIGNFDLHLGNRAHDPLLTCRRDRPPSRWPLCACRQAGPGPAQHPAPASATPSSGRAAPSALSLARADGRWPSAWHGKRRSGGVGDGGRGRMVKSKDKQNKRTVGGLWKEKMVHRGGKERETAVK